MRPTGYGVIFFGYERGQMDNVIFTIKGTAWHSVSKCVVIVSSLLEGVPSVPLSSMKASFGFLFIYPWPPSYQCAWFITWAQKYCWIKEGQTKWMEYINTEISFCVDKATCFLKLLLVIKCYQKANFFTKKKSKKQPKLLRWWNLSKSWVNVNKRFFS